MFVCAQWKDSFDRLEHYIEMAQRVSPVALRALVGTKADLMNDRVVSSQESLVSQLLTSFKMEGCGPS